MPNTKFIHLRYHETIEGRDGEPVVVPSARGGVTIAYCTAEVSPPAIAYAFAQCSPEDNFCKRTGRIKSEGRLRSSFCRRFLSSEGLSRPQIVASLKQAYYDEASFFNESVEEEVY